MNAGERQSKPRPCLLTKFDCLTQQRRIVLRVSKHHTTAGLYGVCTIEAHVYLCHHAEWASPPGGLSVQCVGLALPNSVCPLVLAWRLLVC